MLLLAVHLNGGCSPVGYGPVEAGNPWKRLVLLWRSNGGGGESLSSGCVVMSQIPGCIEAGMFNTSPRVGNFTVG